MADQGFKWWAHPARERKGATAFAVAVLSAAVVATWISFGWAWGLFALVVLALALERWFFPSRFKIDEQGISARCLITRQRFEWREVRRFSHDRYGAYLGVKRKESPVKGQRNMQVLYGRHRHEVLCAIRELLSSARQLDPAPAKESAGHELEA